MEEQRRSGSGDAGSWAIRIGVVLAGVLLLASCAPASGGGSGYSWGWYVVSPGTALGRRNLGFLLQGLVPTITVSGGAFLLSIVLGLVVAILGLSRNPVARVVSRGYVLIFRSIPVLVMILWVYYGLPVSFGIDLSVFAAAVLAMGLCDAAFEAEIFRSGIQSIAEAQIESARSLGFTHLQTLWHVVLPQAIRRIIPPLGNQFVYQLKISSLVSVIGYGELTRRANELIVNEYRPLEIYTILILEYLVLIIVASQGVKLLEKKLSVRETDV